MAELGKFSCDCFIGKMRKGLKIRQCEEKGGGYLGELGDEWNRNYYC